MASLQDMGADMLAKRSADQLCTLSAATRETTGSTTRHRHHGRASLAARSDAARHKTGQTDGFQAKVPQGKAHHGKAARAKVAHAEPAVIQQPDIHSVQ
jgi:hypothetical protein